MTLAGASECQRVNTKQRPLRPFAGVFHFRYSVLLTTTTHLYTLTHAHSLCVCVAHTMTHRWLLLYFLRIWFNFLLPPLFNTPALGVLCGRRLLTFLLHLVEEGGRAGSRTRRGKRMIFLIYFHHHLPTHLRARERSLLSADRAICDGFRERGARIRTGSTLQHAFTAHHDTYTHSHKHIHLYAFIDAHTFTTGILKICHWLSLCVCVCWWVDGERGNPRVR